MARAADLTAVVAAGTMDEPEGSPGHALHSARSARALIGIMWVTFGHLRPSGHIMP